MLCLPNYFPSIVINLLLTIQLPFSSHLCWTSFSQSIIPGLFTLHSFSFPLFVNVSVSLSIMDDICAWYRILGVLFPPSTLKVLFYFLPDSNSFSYQKYDHSDHCCPINNAIFSIKIQDFFFALVLKNLSMICLCGNFFGYILFKDGCISWICKGMSFPKFGEFSATISSDISQNNAFFPLLLCF